MKQKEEVDHDIRNTLANLVTFGITACICDSDKKVRIDGRIKEIAMWDRGFLYPEPCVHHVRSEPQTSATCSHGGPVRNKFNLIHFSFDLFAWLAHVQPHVTFAPLLNKNPYNQDERIL